MAKCTTCAKCEYLHEYETYFCNDQRHPIREEFVDTAEDCAFYEEYVEEKD